MAVALYVNPDEESMLHLPDHDYDSVKLLVDEVYAFLARGADNIDVARSRAVVDTLGFTLEPLISGIQPLVAASVKADAAAAAHAARASDEMVVDEEDPDWDPTYHFVAKMASKKRRRTSDANGTYGYE